MRLTKKQDKKNYPYVYDSFEDYFEGEPINKLGQLEDIEKELGVDLITLFKALEQGYAWIKTKQGIQKATVGAFSLKNLKVVLSYDMCDGGWNFHKNMHLTDYGKTWALTKEELTDGK